MVDSQAPVGFTHPLQELMVTLKKFLAYLTRGQGVIMLEKSRLMLQGIHAAVNQLQSRIMWSRARSSHEVCSNTFNFIAFPPPSLFFALYLTLSLSLLLPFLPTRSILLPFILSLFRDFSFPFNSVYSSLLLPASILFYFPLISLLFYSCVSYYIIQLIFYFVLCGLLLDLSFSVIKV